ncbi:MAG: heme exporter protein CcmB [Rhodospirillales bacterium]|nr:heme exporter protein CcmB [Rhodospirillales bacterium]QQS14873.1 MAG: heme exporter protein CcmB [Rhodospirillales bacterium]
MSRFTTLLARDIRLIWRRPGDVAVVLAFFVLAAALFPLGVGPEPNALRRIAPGVLWVSALFAAMLSLDRLFADDQADGTLDHLILCGLPLELAALAKCLAHWLTSGLPLAILSPALGLLFGLDHQAVAVLAGTLLLGTPSLSLLGGLGAALTLGARRGGALLALLVLPLAVPILIFGVGAVESLVTGDGIVTHFALLGAFLAGGVATLPWAMAAALRQAAE